MLHISCLISILSCSLGVLSAQRSFPLFKPPTSWSAVTIPVAPACLTSCTREQQVNSAIRKRQTILCSGPEARKGTVNIAQFSSSLMSKTVQVLHLEERRKVLTRTDMHQNDTKIMTSSSVTGSLGPYHLHVSSRSSGLICLGSGSMMEGLFRYPSSLKQLRMQRVRAKPTTYCFPCRKCQKAGVSQ